MDEAKKEGKMAADGVDDTGGTLLYPLCLYTWFGVYGASEYVEAGLLALAALGIAHVLTVLSGYWSVHAHCWLTCSKVKDDTLNIYVQFKHCFERLTHLGVG